MARKKSSSKKRRTPGKRKQIKVKSDGSFTSWCKRHGFKGVNCSCIKAALARGGKVAKKANFARNFAHKNCK